MESALVMGKVCGFCGRRLDSEYYITCKICGVTHCWVHSVRHSHEEIIVVAE